MLNIIKINLLRKNIDMYNSNKIKTSKHFPSSTREWNNSIYVYNKKNLNLIANAMILAIKFIKSYFSLYNHNIERKIRRRRLLRKFKRLSSHRIYISNGEFKHTNNKVLINLYVFNRQKYNYILALKKLFLKSLVRKHKLFKNNFLKRNDIQFSNKLNSRNKINFISNLKKSVSNTTKFNKISNLVLSKLKKIYIFKRLKIKHIDNKKIKKINLEKAKFNIKHNKYITFFFNKDYNIKTNLKKIGFTIPIYSKKTFHGKKYMKTKIILFKQNILFCLNKIFINKLKIDTYDKFSSIKIIKINIIKYSRLNKQNIISNIKKQNNIFSNVSRKKNKFILRKLENLKKLVLLPFLLNKNYGFITINKLSTLLLLIRRKKLMHSIKRKRYFIIKNLMRNKGWYITKYINDFYKSLISKSFKKLKLYMYYRQLLHINNSKYNYNYLQYLTKHLYNLYNKNIEYNLINLKGMHLHSDILTESLLLKLTKNRARLVRKLKHIKRKIRIKKKEFFMNKIIQKKNTNQKKIISKKNLIRQFRYKKITGLRIQLKGRLTRRYTASRSRSKLLSKGNLLNIYSSYKGTSSILLRGNLKSGLQYTKLKSKSRIGSFGIKGWVSGN